MAKEKHITIVPTKSEIGKARVDFQPDAIDDLIAQKGLDIIYESAIVCPCSPQGGSPLSSCLNCGGSGLVFINPTKTVAVVMSINNKEKRFVAWSEETDGTVNVTTRNDIRVGHMDRITILDSESLYGQRVFMEYYKDDLFGYLSYEPKTVLDVFIFDGQNKALNKLNEDQYSIDGNVIKLLDRNLGIDDENGLKKLTIRYLHEVQYLVVSNIHDIRNTKVKSGGRTVTSKLPVSAVAQRVHQVMEANDQTGKKLFNNSYIFGDNSPCITPNNDTC
jgi:hypothetical protein